MACLILDSPKPVPVIQGDEEFDGSLLAWQQPAHRGDQWRALVQNYRDVGMQHEHWVSQAEVWSRG
ncbi:MAG TPA: hypothetical protein VIM19_19265 [Actinomycetes bacterium]